MAKFDNLSDSEFKTIIESSTQWTELAEKFGYTSSLSSNLKKKILDRCNELGINWKDVVPIKTVNSRTKGDLFDSCKNWQSARSTIRRDADRVFNKSNKEKKCVICGYDKVIQVAHIKAVSEFPKSALISEINNIDNLVALCPNHHWEFDHNLLSDEDKVKIK